MGLITQYISVNVLKIAMFLALLYLAHKWSKGDMNKHIAKMRSLKKRYGIMTMLLVIVWWLLTPSGLPDDFVTLYFIDTFGLLIYIFATVALTIYLVWRLGITLVIFEN